MTTEQDASPSARDAEQAVVAAILRETELFAKVSRRLSADKFEDPRHRELYRELDKLHRRGDPIDLLIVRDALKANAAFRKADDDPTAYLAEIQDKFTQTELVGYHSLQIVDAADKRFLAEIGQTTHAHAMNGNAPREILANLLADLDDLRREIDRTADDKAAMFRRWAESIVNRTAVTSYTCAPDWSDLRKFQVVAGRVVVAGAPPGTGKTALFNQLVFDALRADGQEDLRVLILSVEVPPPDLLTRQLARLSNVGIKHLIEGTYDPDAEPRIQAGIGVLEDVLHRVDFVTPPFTLERLQERCEACAPQVVLVDYVQRVDHADPSRDARSQCTQAMSVLRQIAADDRAVLAISAVNRNAYESGATGLAAFRESSELEYGADSAWLLVRGDDDPAAIELRCVKNRQGELSSIRLRFNGSRMEFEDDRHAYDWNPGDA